MQDNGSNFSPPPKKFQPRGLTILFEDREILVVDKINGLLTIGTDREREKTAHFLLNEYVKRGNHRSRNRVFIVHRLDRDTSGLLIFAKSESTKRYLQENWQGFSKSYYTIVHGQMSEKEGVITSYLLESKAFRVYSVDDPQKGKLAQTGYKVVKESRDLSLLEIQLLTGRKNQIRVHLSEKGHPVHGDKIYGNEDKGVKRLALHSASLKITHPVTLKEMSFTTGIPPYFKTVMKA